MASTNNIDQENVLIDLPNEYLQSGKILLIQRTSEISIDGFHLTKSFHPIRENHHLSLIDLEHHLTKENLSEDRHHLFQLIIQLNPEYFRQGKSIEIDKSERNDSIEFVDENQRETNEMKIHLNCQTLQRGFVQFIQNGKSSLIDQNQFSNDSKYHWNKNLFTIRDYLQSNQSMEILIAIDPEFFRDNLRLILKKEDSKSISTHFPYRRLSKVTLEEQIQQNKDKLIFEEFLHQNQWNPKLFDENHFLQISIDLKKSSRFIQNEEQIKIDPIEHNSLRIQLISSSKSPSGNENPSNWIEQISFPRQVQIHQMKFYLDANHQILYLSFPLLSD